MIAHTNINRMAVPSPSNKTNRRTPCHWCVRAVKWIPVLFILTIVVWSYYAYVVQLCICKFYLNNKSICSVTVCFLVTVQSTAETIIFLILYHILFVMFVWSYFQTIFIEVGRVPEKVHENNNNLNLNLQLQFYCFKLFCFCF